MHDTSHYWAQHIAAIQKESVSIAEYARRQGLDPQQLYRWRHRLKNESAVQNPTHEPTQHQRHIQSNRFISVQLEDSMTTDTNGCILRLGPGISLELSTLPDPQWLVRVLNASRSQ